MHADWHFARPLHLMSRFFRALHKSISTGIGDRVPRIGDRVTPTRTPSLTLTST